MPPMSNGFGEHIEDYKELEFLGKGGFGCVYKARCLNTGIIVAIKKIDKNLMQQHGMIGRVREEVNIHSRLQHPSILKLYTYFEDAKYVYMVLELCPNGDLQRFLKEHYAQGLSEDKAAKIIKQVVEGLLYLHNHKIIHRDMSPSNLLLTADMQVKIADFGLATLTKPNQNHMTLCGTPNYISPEVATRSSHGPQADVWGLGCLLYTLLVGKAPFDTEGVQSTLTRVVMGDYTIPSHLSDSAKDLISRLLKKNQNDRIELRDILKHSFITSKDKKYQEKILLSRALSRDRMGDSGVGKTMSSVDGMPRGRSRSEERTSMLPSMCNPLAPHFTVRSDPVIDRNNCQNNFAYQSKRNDYSREQTSVRSGIPPSRSRVFSHISVEDVNRERNDKPKYREQVLDNFKNQDLNAKLQIPPLNSRRLLPTRHRTRNVVLTILENGEVCLEFIKKKNCNTERIGEVCRISSDGLRIVLYKLRESRPIGDKPPPLPIHGADNIYSYENLPSRHHRKYIYAARFVNLVKAKTPKITLYTDRAKIHFMENGSPPDCEIHFYDGIKVTYCDNVIKITDSVGNSYKEGNVPHELKEYYEHYSKCYQRCVDLESSLNSLEQVTGYSYFPAIIGRKPLSAGSAPSLQGKENVSRMINSPRIMNNSPVMPSFDNSYSVMSTVTSKSKKTNPNRSIQYAYKKVYVNGIGYGIQLPNGDVKIEYKDGSTLTVFPESRGHDILYEENSGMITKYSKRQHEEGQMPYEVQEKLRRDLPIVFAHLVHPRHRNIR